MEIEAKYRAEQPIAPTQIESLSLVPYRLGPRETHDLFDTLLDTEGFALSQQSHTLRVRRDGPRHILTLKGPGTVEGGTHRREEWEETLAEGDDPFDRAAWPSSIGARLNELIGDEPLHPAVTIQNHRRTWAVHRDGGHVGEIALDEGTIQAGGLTEPLHEVEVELKGRGTTDDLAALTGALCGPLPLVPEPHSKAKRGLMLLGLAGGRPRDG